MTRRWRHESATDRRELAMRGHSERLRLREVRAIFRLLDELRDLRNDQPAQNRRLILGLRDVVGGNHGFLTQMRGFRRNGPLIPERFEHAGNLNPRILEYMVDFGRNHSFHEDPITHALAASARIVTAGSTNTITGYEAYRASRFHHEYSDPAGIRDTHVASIRLPGPGDRIIGYSIQSMHDQPEATPRTVKLNNLFASEWARLKLAGKLDPPPDPAKAARGRLTSRQRDVFDALITGERPKAIADRLGLRESAVRSYVREVYQRLGVRDHIDLLVRFARR